MSDVHLAPFRRSVLAACAPYLIAALLSSACAVYLLQLWRMEWNVPMYYASSGDVYYLYSLLKTMSTSGWFFSAPQLGAPFGAHLIDFPVPNVLHLGIMRGLIALTSSYGAAANLYFVLLFPLTTVAAMYALRRLGVPVFIATAIAVIYSFLPTRLERNQSHLFYSAYYLAPLGVLVAIWIIRGNPLFDATLRRPTRDGWIALAVALALSWDNPYYVLFFGTLFTAGAVAATVRTGTWRPAAATLGLVVVMGAGLAVAFGPTIVYRAEHGPNTAALKRRPEEAELLALSLAQLVLPIEGHRIALFAAERQYYNERLLPTNLVNENSTASNGILASAGFLGLLFALIVVRRYREDELWPDVARLTVVAFLLATVGGVGALLAFYVVPEFRAYNRISPIIGFLSFVAVAFAMRALGARFPRVGRPVRPLAVALVALIAIADETSPVFVPRYAASHARYASDAQLAVLAQSAFAKNAAVLQLPTMRYPEGDPAGSLKPYDQLAVYLHSRDLRWSYGGITGRPEGDWATGNAAKPTRAMIEAALIAGFSGIVVYRRGYADAGMNVEREIKMVTGRSPLVTPDGNVALFALTPIAQGIAQLLAAPGTAGARSANLALGFGSALYPEESSAGRRSRWSSGSTVLIVHNPTPDPIEGALSFVAASAQGAQKLSVTLGDEPTATPEITDVGVRMHLDHVFMPGDTRVRFVPGAPPTHAGADPRPVSFRLIDLSLRGVDVGLLRRVSPAL